MFKSKLRKYIPRLVLSAYHYIIARLAAAWYGFPSRQLVVIGVTGTKGKTTTANFIWAVLEAGGKSTGLVSTALFRIHDRQMLNPYHMTMPAPFTLQQFLREMADEGCTHCVLETTSEGLAQWRHVGIWYDIAVLTNITSEHIEAHGGFEAYRAAKGKLFTSLMQHPQKRVDGEEVPRVALLNNDSEHRDFFLRFPVEHVATFGLKRGADYVAEDVVVRPQGATFRVKGAHYALRVAGAFNVQNALPAVAIGEMLGISPATIAEGLASLRVVPGRMEEIEEKQAFTAIVDYAHEAVSMEAALTAARQLAKRGGKLIALLGAEGGGRDEAKRPAMGECAGRFADYVVVSNVDPYDDPPGEIIEDIARAVEDAGKTREKNLFCIEDRREGIRKALSLAGKGDVVLITGKGAEQSMIIKGEKIPWDDRMVVREEMGVILPAGRHGANNANRSK
ncbi:MAG: UDP-N-acetylmuramoyl-L-alanyl-D-glutamate--2,6-diaminopimelate ligase [Candidatus Liptonbacteria bacterium]|nr:UDP-N-acetylmuramoyl-L-alanyl-D-glutamate--2,6-diaminopimelate ligase [Candidatus Liptonbacteria bacterium]